MAGNFSKEPPDRFIVNPAPDFHFITSKKGRPIMVYNGFLLYSHYDSRKQVDGSQEQITNIYSCKSFHDGCPFKVWMRDGIYLRETREPHSHEPDPAEVQSRTIVERAKEMLIQDPTAKVKHIIERLIRCFGESMISDTDKENLRRLLLRLRKKLNGMPQTTNIPTVDDTDIYGTMAPLDWSNFGGDQTLLDDTSAEEHRFSTMSSTDLILQETMKSSGKDRSGADDSDLISPNDLSSQSNTQPSTSSSIFIKHELEDMFQAPQTKKPRILAEERLILPNNGVNSRREMHSNTSGCKPNVGSNSKSLVSPYKDQTLPLNGEASQTQDLKLLAAEAAKAAESASKAFSKMAEFFKAFQNQ